MKGSLMRRVGASAAVVAAFAAVAASPASAMIAPACDTRLVTATASSASCSFDSNTDWALITMQPVGGSVTATVRCFTQWGYTYERSRTASSATTWSTSAPGSCSLTLTAADGSLIAANASATPMFQIYS